MRQREIILKKRKKERIKIRDINDFKDALKREGHKINKFDEEKFKEEIMKILGLENSVVDMIYMCLDNNDITYKADDVNDFIDYIVKIALFENEHNKLCEKIKEVKSLNIHRIEYDRVMSNQDNVEDVLKVIEEIKSKICRNINYEEKAKLENLEREIGEEYLYAKDIELLKKMVTKKEEDIKKEYNFESKVKSISLEIPKNIECNYIKPHKGSVEYHQHLSSNIPRMQRLIKNLNKYMKVSENETTTFEINQSKALQDTINIAVATYDNKEFKAISGSNNITNYCIAPKTEEEVFECCKVNKLGKLGIGYKRVNDSEKKILEEIHKQIEGRILKAEGNLILYSKWEPCPSCYFVISQFCKRYPGIKMQVKYSKKYGE